MIAVDTSTWIGFLQGDGGEDAELLDRALQDQQVLMVPVVLTEVLSDPKLPAEVSQTLSELPLIGVEPGYWQRAAVRIGRMNSGHGPAVLARLDPHARL
jgi:hypothetical protein